MSTWFEQVLATQKDGRAYLERERQAVNRVAARISSYRDLAAALVNAKDGDTLTISETFEVTQTIPIKKNNLTITCVGKGGLVPSKEGLTLFKIENAVNFQLVGVKALANKKKVEWETFVALEFKESQSDNFVTDCHVESKNFILATGGATDLLLTTLNFRDFVGSRTYILNNVHKSTGSTTAFLDGNLNMATISKNETTGYIQFTGIGTFVTNNMVLGAVDVGGLPCSIHIGTTSQNIVVSNIFQNGAPPIVFNAGVTNIVANNLATS